jgi:DNA primase
VHARSNGLLECGHEPFHSSKSGRCVLIVPSAGRWVCRSCNRRGDAASFVMALRGVSYAVAAAELEQRFGPALRSSAPTDGAEPSAPVRRKRTARRLRALVLRA